MGRKPAAIFNLLIFGAGVVWKFGKPVVAGMLSIIGLGGMPDDIEKWEQWLARMDVNVWGPWFLIAVGAIGILNMYADDLLRFFGHILSPVKFEPVQKENVWFSLGEDHGGKQTFIGVYIPIIFKFRVRSAWYRVDAFHFKPLGEYKSKHVWQQQISGTFLRGDDKKIPLLYVPEKTNAVGVYGDKSLDGYKVASNSAHLLIVRVFVCGVPIKKTLLVTLPDDRGMDSPGGGIGQRNLLRIITEDDNPFEEYRNRIPRR